MKKLLLFLLLPGLVFAKETIVVSAEKVERGKNETTSSVVVIGEEEIEESMSSNLSELIEDKSGLFLNSNGAYGKSTSLFLRGADSSFTLIIVDGVEYSDRSSVGGSSVLDHIDLSNVEKVEILKGSQSVLYGSDALAGVINITTKTPDGTKEALGSLAYGSYKNKRANFTARNAGEKVNYSMGLSFQDVEGISSYNEDRAVMAEKDGYNNLTASFKANTKFSKKDLLEFNLRGVKAESDFDASTADKLDYVSRDAQMIAKVNYSYKVNDLWTPKVSVSHNKSDRLANSFSLSRLVSKVNKIEVENPVYLNNSVTLLNGLEYEKTDASIETIDNKKGFESLAAFLDSHLSVKKLKLHLGGRWTKESSYSDQLVWKAGALYPVLKKTMLKINASTGFKSPSLYQLYSNFGNENLIPTKSESFDFSIVQYIFSSKFELTYFNDNYDNIIDYDPLLSRYMNISKSENKGAEANYYGEFKSLDWKLGATWLRAINKSSGKEGDYLPRRPREKYNVSIGWKFNSKFKAITEFSYVGERENSDFDNIILSSYNLLDFKFDYKIAKKNSLSFKVGNALDKSYEQVYGYGTPGRNFLLKWYFSL
jgi:vitamin B12 transporter